ncbi:EXPA20 [Linum grandiflorum]
MAYSSLPHILFLCFLSLNITTTAAFTYDDSHDGNPPSAPQEGQGDGEWKSATATYIKQPDGGSISLGGACGYGDVFHFLTYGRYSAGLSAMLFNRGSTCGACFQIRCVDHILWCLQGSPSVTLTATDFCPPNYALSSDYGGWCNFPKRHFELSEAAFAEIAEVKKADIVPVQYRKVKCNREGGGVRFTASGSRQFYQVLITNVGGDGEVVGVKVKGRRTGWIPMARNWGQNWQCFVDLIGQPLSFEVTTSDGKTVTSYNVAPYNWMFGQTFQGKQFSG